jgi:putative transposase
MILAHKIRLYPTNEQAIELTKACGCARFTYNWALDEWKKMYDAHKSNPTFPKPNANLLKKKFNSIKSEQFPWVYDSPKDANQRAFTNLNNAFQMFFKGISDYPVFKKKNNKMSFYISNDKFSVKDYKIQLPRIGIVEMTEKLRFEGKIKSAAISKTANKWFVSIAVDVGDEVYKKSKSEIIKNDVLGIDLGLTTFATGSDGSQVLAPKPLKKHLKQLKRLNRKYSRSKKDSKNREKARMRLAKKHATIANIRHDFLHKLTTQTCRENQTVVIEDLSVKKMMMKNHHLAQAIGDVGWGEYRRQMAYKNQIYDANLIVAPPFYPSSKTCSCCGWVDNDLTLEDRTFECKECGLVMDRDLNASINLHTLGLKGINACGDETSNLLEEPISQVLSLKQESVVVSCENVNIIYTDLHKL